MFEWGLNGWSVGVRVWFWVWFLEACMIIWNWADVWSVVWGLGGLVVIVVLLLWAFWVSAQVIGE
jgi:hypothetical protein